MYARGMTEGVTMADSTFTLRVDEDLKQAFAAVAESEERTAAQLLRLLMRRTVDQHDEAASHDTWFRSEVQQALASADDPDVDRYAHDEVRSSWLEQRAELERRASGRIA